jgi:6,7-dimethyl-8-ribityllumazine synthase
MASIHQNLSDYDFEKVPNAEPFRFGIVVSEWNKNITLALLKGCVETLSKHGALDENIHVAFVPGSFELTYGAKKMHECQKPDAIICLGSVIRGETPHFDFVCHGVTRGIVELNLNLDCPVIFGVLTDDTLQQSIDRSGGKHGNKGVEAAVTAIKMAAYKP